MLNPLTCLKEVRGAQVQLRCYEDALQLQGRQRFWQRAGYQQSNHT